jgi:hypothetical protein
VFRLGIKYKFTKKSLLQKFIVKQLISYKLTHIAGEAGKNRQNSVHKRYFINNSGYGKMQYSGYQALING